MELPKDTPRAKRTARRGRAARAWTSLLAWLAKIPGWGWFVLVMVVLLPVALWGYRFPWSGFAAATVPKPDKLEYPPYRTLWDWMGLLVIPVLLTIGGILVTHRREEAARKREIKRSREEVLQGYLDRMTRLMLDNSLHKSGDDDPVRDVARALTLQVLRRLDGKRKGHLLRFLRESELIVKGKTILSLKDADLRGAVLRVADLHNSDLSGADFGEADLTWAFLVNADLRGAKLGEADLTEALLLGADLSGADLSGADLSGANLFKAALCLVHLTEALLIGAKLGEADLRGALLTGAKLGWANLRGAKLGGANFGGADLGGADLTGADLRVADLIGGAGLMGGHPIGGGPIGAVLDEARNLTQGQIDSARGDALTQLPEGLVRPPSWGDAAAT